MFVFKRVVIALSVLSFVGLGSACAERKGRKKDEKADASKDKKAEKAEKADASKDEKAKKDAK